MSLTSVHKYNPIKFNLRMSYAVVFLMQEMKFDFNGEFPSFVCITYFLESLYLMFVQVALDKLLHDIMMFQ